MRGGRRVVPRTARAPEAHGQSLPPAEMLPPGGPSLERGHAHYQKLAARRTYSKDEVLNGPSAWCEANEAHELSATCPCLYDGLHGPLCEGKHETFCLNQCSGHGRCDHPGGGYCHCDEGYFGIDCSMTTDTNGHVALHKDHAAAIAPRSPSIFVYELWDHTSLILQYRAYQGYCVHRTFDATNGTMFNDNYA